MHIYRRSLETFLLKIMQRALLLCFATFLLSSCIAQKLPYHETGYGLVAIPYEVSNQTSYRLVKAIVLKSSSDESFSIRIDMPPFNDDVVFSKPLPEGSYVVDYSMAVSVPVSGIFERGTQGRDNFLNPIRIDLKDGEIVVFPLLYKADQYRRSDYITCNIDYEKLDPAQESYYLKKLSAMENGDQWRVRAAP